MANLKYNEKQIFEKLFDRDGYVLDFNNRSFGEFFRDFNIEILSEKYNKASGSKMNRLRAFWEIEDDRLVGEVLESLLELANSAESVDAKDYDLAKIYINRLLGKTENEKKDKHKLTEGEFLKKDFSNISISNLKLESQLVPIVESRLKEICCCLNANAPLASIFLCGSILEGILLGLAQQYPEKFNKSSSSPKCDKGNVEPFHRWTLNSLINVSNNIGFLGLDVKKFSHVLRDFRNYIHPHQQMVAKFNPDKHTAEMCLQVLKAAIADLSKEKEIENFKSEK